MSSGDLFTRDEVLAGLPAKRASALLFLIESRTAQQVARSRQAMERFLTEEAASERELAFLEAFALGKDPPLRPTIQDLERHAAQWAGLLPENPRIRAAFAHLIGQKYTFTYSSVPGIRAALGLDADGQALIPLERKACTVTIKLAELTLRKTVTLSGAKSLLSAENGDSSLRSE